MPIIAVELEKKSKLRKEPIFNGQCYFNHKSDAIQSRVNILNDQGDNELAEDIDDEVGVTSDKQKTGLFVTLVDPNNVW